MTNIWEERPEPERWIKFDLPVEPGESVQITHFKYEPMKAWLERLKEEWDAILKHHITQETGMQKEINELREKVHGSASTVRNQE